jgi:hypothetical protein
MTKVLGEEHAPFQAALQEQLKYCSPVDRQVAMELLAATHAFQCSGGSLSRGQFILDSMHKHMRQLLARWFEYAEGRDGL